MSNSENKLTPRKPLFPLSADDIVDNALENLDETQARRVTEKAADEIVKMAVEKRKAEHLTNLAQNEMRNLIENANLLDNKVGDYKINSTFETASGTTNVEISKAKPSNFNTIAIIVGLLTAAVILYVIFR